MTNALGCAAARPPVSAQGRFALLHHFPYKNLVDFTYAIDMTLGLLTNFASGPRIKLEFHLHLVVARFGQKTDHKLW